MSQDIKGHDDITIDDKYLLVKELGAGAQGSVYCIKNTQTGGKYASKLVSSIHRGETPFFLTASVTSL